MEIEENFSGLVDSLLALYKNTLLRSFFFNFINIHYETTIFKAQPTNTKQKSAEKSSEKPPVKSLEEEKINTKLDAALESAKKVWTGAKPVEAKKVEAKPKKELKKPVSKIGAGKKPSTIAPKFVQSSINPLECYKITSILINPELMTQYQDLKSRLSSSLYNNLGGQSQGKKAEMTAKKNFLAKLNKKFTSKNIRTEVDEIVAKTYTAYKVLGEIQLIFNDEEILQSFFELASSPVKNYGNKDVRTRLCKASFMLNWVQGCIEGIRNLNTAEANELVFGFKNLIKNSVSSAETIQKNDGFVTEKTILDELMKTCTKEEIKEVIGKYNEFDKWRLKSDVNKFISAKLQTTKSLPGLRVLHSLGCKNGRTFCTFTKK